MRLIRKWSNVTGAVGLLSLLLASLIFYLLVPMIIISEVGKQQALKNGSEAWNRWVNTPLSLEFKVYLFNVTNPEEVMTGSKPILQEVGPFVYKETRYKIDLQVNQENETIFYRQRSHFEFDVEKSKPLTEETILTVLNPALMGMVNMATGLHELYGADFIARLLDGSIPFIFESSETVFSTVSARSIIFDGISMKCMGRENGYVETMCDILRQFLPIKPITETADGDFLVSAFGYKNNSDEGVMEVYSGISEPDLLGKLVSWNYEKHAKAWPEPCNKITGSDMTLPPLYPTNKPSIFMFSSDICSAIEMEKNGEVTFSGMKGYQYVPSKSFMKSKKQYPENGCYCPGPTIENVTKPGECMGDGVLDLSSCLNVPLILSRPHFYKTDQVYASTVEGLHPNESKHETFMESEKYTGTPLRGYRRFQISMFLRRDDSTNIFKNVPNETLVPILWLDEGAELSQNEIDLLNSLLYNKLASIDLVKQIWIIVGVALVSISVAFVVIQKLISLLKLHSHPSTGIPLKDNSLK